LENQPENIMTLCCITAKFATPHAQKTAANVNIESNHPGCDKYDLAGLDIYYYPLA
jgi:hypothetical protein